MKFENKLSPEAYEIVRGPMTHQGTYVNFEGGIGLCREYGLSQLEKRLYSLKNNIGRADRESEA